MSGIVFDLNGCDLSFDDFRVLLDRCVKTDLMVNGYVIEWEYDVVDNVVLLNACLLKIR